LKRSRGVTEEVLDSLRASPCQQVQSGARMAQIVEPNVRAPASTMKRLNVPWTECGKSGMPTSEVNS
jgi:hypothetical protein